MKKWTLAPFFSSPSFLVLRHHYITLYGKTVDRVTPLIMYITDMQEYSDFDLVIVSGD